MAATDRRRSLSTRRSIVVRDFLSMLLIPILLLISAPCTRSQGPLPCTDNFFIVADRGLNNIYQVDASSGATAQLLPVGAANQPTAVAYDPDARSIYWTNGGTNITINKYSLLTNSSTVIYRDAPRPHNAVFAGLAIDVGRQKLYYSVDEGSGNAGEVGELSTDGTDHKALNWRKWGVPQSVVIDVDNRVLYWTDYIEPTGVFRIPVNGTAQPDAVVSGQLQRPTALAINFTAGVMYWADGAYRSIETASLNGTGRRRLLHEWWPWKHEYGGFALHDGVIYFTDAKNKYIRTLDIARRSTSTFRSDTRFQHPVGIVYVPGISNETTTTTTTSTTQATTNATTTYTSFTTEITATPTTATTATNSTVTTVTPTPEPCPSVNTMIVIAVVACIVVLVIILIIAIATIAICKLRPRLFGYVPLE